AHGRAASSAGNPEEQGARARPVSSRAGEERGDVSIGGGERAAGQREAAAMALGRGNPGRGGPRGRCHLPVRTDDLLGAAAALPPGGWRLRLRRRDADVRPWSVFGTLQLRPVTDVVAVFVIA